MRGHPQSFDKAVRAIRMMAAIPGFVFDVVTCVNKHNYAQLNELKEFLIGIGLKQWRLFTVFPVGVQPVMPNFNCPARSFVECWILSSKLVRKGVYASVMDVRDF